MKTRVKMCENCGNPVGIVFYVVKVTQAVVNLKAIERHTAVARILGGSERLADVLSPEETFERMMRGSDANAWPESTICLDCYCTTRILVKTGEKPEDRTPAADSVHERSDPLM